MPEPVGREEQIGHGRLRLLPAVGGLSGAVEPHRRLRRQLEVLRLQMVEKQVDLLLGYFGHDEDDVALPSVRDPVGGEGDGECDPVGHRPLVEAVLELLLRRGQHGRRLGQGDSTVQAPRVGAEPLTPELDRELDAAARAEQNHRWSVEARRVAAAPARA